MLGAIAGILKYSSLVSVACYGGNFGFPNNLNGSDRSGHFLATGESVWQRACAGNRRTLAPDAAVNRLPGLDLAKSGGLLCLWQSNDLLQPQAN